LTADKDLKRRAPTVSITHAHKSASEVVEHLARHEVYAWAGNMYALVLAEVLGVESRGGFVRLGLVHYNTLDEIDRTVRVLDAI
jgi:selenocysteine lyase/cysteine desulfurase